MEDFFNLISLKNSNYSSVVIGGSYHAIHKALYPLLWKYSNERNRDIKSLLDACQNYSYSEGDFHKEFPSEFNKHLIDNGRTWVLRKRYTEKFTESRLTVILFTATILEGIINEYLLIKSSTNSQFKRLTSDIKKQYGLFQKWTDAPKKLIPSYRLATTYISDLKELIKQRNNIVHNEPYIEINSIVKTRGKLNPLNSNNMTEQILAFMDLPKNLLENLFKYDDSNEIIHFKMFCQSSYD